MYRVELSESYFPAQTGEPVLETTVGGVLRAQAAATPDAEALVEARTPGEPGRVWTYARLLADAERLARALRSRYQPCERIAVWAPNAPEWVILEYGAALAGLTLVTANPAYQPRELRYVLEQSGAVGLFIVREHRGNPMARIAAEVARDLPRLREVVDLEDSAAFFAGAAAGAELPEVSPLDPAQIQYTSGTTGFPKGVLLHHRGITNNGRISGARMGLTQGATLLNPMPLFHTAGCVLLTLSAVQYGMRMILPRMFDPNQILDLIESERVDFHGGVPTMLVGLLQAQAARPRDVGSTKGMFSGGSMVPPELARQVCAAFGCDFYTVYGQTEASCLVTVAKGSAQTDPFDTVGQPLAQTEVAIRDPRSGTLVPVGAVGEVCVRSFGILMGYNDDPKATAAAIDPEGWLRTGDLGTLDASGRLRITGRVKEMIIRGGENLFPAEIENIVLEHADVAEAAVVGVPDEVWGEIVVCFLRMTPGARLDRAGLVAHCRAQISAPKTPVHWVEVGEWPLTGSGKIQKFVLRDRFVAGDYTPAS